MNTQVYAELDNCDIVAIVNGNSIVYVICDKDGKQIDDNMFTFAADAIIHSTTI
jgi:hypothetical protein